MKSGTDSELKTSSGEPAPRGLLGSLSLRTKFLVGIGLILLWFCSTCAFLIYMHDKYALEDTAYAKSQIVMAAMEANQAYVREVLRPRLFDLFGNDVFVLEGMSTSYVSRAVMDRFNGAVPEYQYRRVAVNARNPDSEANPIEVRMIQYFAQNPHEDNWQGIIGVSGESCFMRFRPVYFDDSCMHCHGAPQDAPKALVALYGPERGFGRTDGQLAGVIAVGIPVDVALAQIREKALSVFMTGFLFAAVLFTAISFFFNRVVVHDLRGLLQIFRKGLHEDEQTKFFSDERSQDELKALTTAATAMADHLRDTRRQLEQNALNLERTVAERTRELRKSRQHLRDQVVARNRELQALNTVAELTTQAVTLAEIFPKALKQTLKMIPAKGAGLYLSRNNSQAVELQWQEHAPQLPRTVPLDSCPSLLLEDARDLPSSLAEAACGHISLFTGEACGRCLSVPLCCRGRVLGVITFAQVEFTDIPAEMHGLLSSVGRQIGIAIESLQSREKLLQSKELLQSVFDGITDPVILLDRDCRIRMVNGAFLKRYGLQVHMVLDLKYDELAAASDCPCPLHCIEAVLRSKAPVTEEVQSRGGEIFLVHFYPITDETHEVVSVVRYARDITDQKRVEQQIHKAEKLASLGQLAAGVAHEINNPLGVILCYTDLLKRQLDSFPQGLKDVGTIEKHAVNCQRIVSDLLKFSRGHATSKHLTSLNRSIEEVVELLANQFRREKIEVFLDLDPSLPFINMDGDKMKQAYVNLFMNSVQAMPGEGTIRVSTRHIAALDQIRIDFWDSGKGIAPDVIGRVFDPFFSTKPAGEGTGLGLSVTYGIIRDHQGEIHVESEPGKWTQFTILLPVSEAQ